MESGTNSVVTNVSVTYWRPAQVMSDCFVLDEGHEVVTLFFDNGPGEAATVLVTRECFEKLRRPLADPPSAEEER